ncbi:hypothetical protein BWI93_15630 [Siphonobacter sp. BAB-5385]|nr:hypothetical protein BWI93_15630 [Siphonobacter sp. BAB-5385]
MDLHRCPRIVNRFFTFQQETEQILMEGNPIPAPVDLGLITKDRNGLQVGIRGGLLVLYTGGFHGFVRIRPKT